MQQGSYLTAEVVYRKAQSIDPDANKACNLCLCLVKQTRYLDAQLVLDDIFHGKILGSDDPKTINRANELFRDLAACQSSVTVKKPSGLEDAFVEGLDQLMSQWNPYRSKRLPIFEEISPYRDQLAC